MASGVSVIAKVRTGYPEAPDDRILGSPDEFLNGALVILGIYKSAGTLRPEMAD